MRTNWGRRNIGRTAGALFVFVSVFLLCIGRGAFGQALSADLSDHLIGITSGFAGTSILIFGATDGPGDVVVIVRGPDHSVAVRRKKRMAGIWLNSRQEIFLGVPSFYGIASTRPLNEVAMPSLLQFYQFGVENLRLVRQNGPIRDEDKPFRDALIATQQQDNLFSSTPERVDFLGDHLFRTNLIFPANVPTGTYLVEVFLLRNKAVVTAQTIPLVISKIGGAAEIYDFADNNGALYGIVAVVAAAMAGLLASLPFRNA